MGHLFNPVHPRSTPLHCGDNAFRQECDSVFPFEAANLGYLPRRGLALLKTGVVLSLLMASSALAQNTAPPAAVQRGFETLPVDSPSVHGHHFVVVIGIDHYQNWPILGTAVSDATGFAKLLTGQFGFEYAVEPLTEQGATRDNINSLIDDDLRGRLKPEDDLVIFFAGHGTTRNDKVGDETQSVGFLVPFEARAPGTNEHWSDYLNIEELLRKISSLPPQHILVILDSCHSGMALGSKFTTSRADTRFQQDMLRKVSRKVITSAQGDQLAADSGPLSGHSLFTGLMMQGLMSGKADSFGQGFITSTQLGAYTQHEVGVQEGSRQTPLFGGFDLDGGGELIIPLGSGAAGAANSPGKQTAALTPLESAEIAKLKKEDRGYWQDDDPLKNFPAARSATVKLCESGDGWGCAQAADSLRKGLGGGMDYARAVELARKGCQANVSASCVILGILYEQGQAIQPDKQAAARLYRDACTQGNLRGCADLGNLYQAGQGVARDYGQARSLFSKACDGGEMVGCSNLGLLDSNGLGTPVNFAEAAGFYSKACNGGEAAGCYNLGKMAEDGDGAGKDAAQAVTFFQRACDAGEMRGCSKLGLMYETGVGVAKDSARSIDLYRKACSGGEATGCFSLGVKLESGQGIAQDFAQSVSMFRKACDGGDMRGCNNLGVMYETGLGVDKDASQAVFFYGKACDGEDMVGCKYVGMMYSSGQGVDRDASRAAAFYRKACDGGNADACAMVRSPN
jgi:TPR repeat protein